MAYTKYSLTPANNTATPPDGAPEGMLPSAVNDTMRDMMAQIRDCGDGIRDGTYTMTAPKITGGTITGVALSGNTFTSPVISGGSINNTPIGASTANTGAFTTLSASGATTFSGATVVSGSLTANTFSSSGATITGGSINSTAIGGSTAAAGKFTTLEATGVTTVQAGTVSAPAITTSGDTNTGIFFPAADTIAFTEGGAEAMRIDSSGNVGIGTSSPNRQLTLTSNTEINSVSTVYHYFGPNGTNLQGFVGYNGDGFTDIGARSGYGIRFNTAQSGAVAEVMRITAAGNVGIGTSSPGVLLDVSKAQATDSSIRIINSSSNASARAVVLFGNDTSTGSVGFFLNSSANTGLAGANSFNLYQGLNAPVSFWTNATERMRITSGGNVGIGNSSPNNTLSIQAGTASVRLDSSTGTNAVYSQFVNTGGNFYVGRDNSTGTVFGAAYASVLFSEGAYPMNFYTAGTERMRITSGGTVVVGTTAQVGSEILGALQTADNQCFAIQANNASYTNDAQIIYANRNTTNNSFYYFACYNIGATAYKFRIADSGNATNTNGSYGTISDAKLKENIVDATPKLDKVNQLKVRNYNFIGDDLKQIGFVAQEFEQVFPSMVEESADKDKDGNDLGTTTKTIKTTVLIPILVKAIQEQQAMIEELKAKVTALENK